MAGGRTDCGNTKIRPSRRPRAGVFGVCRGGKPRCSSRLRAPPAAAVRVRNGGAPGRILAHDDSGWRKLGRHGPDVVTARADDRRAEGAAGPDRHRRRGPAGGVHAALGRRPGVAAGASWPRCPSRSTRTPGGNLWATLRGTSDRELVIGGHLDSVPNGGWLDGCLNVVAGLEVLRRIAAEGTPPVTVRLVDWCDEEGARFGRSLFGSSAASGALVADEVRDLTDRDGRPAGRRRPRARHRRRPCHRRPGRAGERGRPTWSCTSSRGRCCWAWTSRWASSWARSASSGTRSPSPARRPTAGRRRWATAATPWAACPSCTWPSATIAVRHGGVGTVGSVKTRPGIVTAVVGEAEMTLDHAAPGRGRAGRHVRRGPGGQPGDRRRGADRRRVEAALVHPAVPVPPRPDRPGRAGRGRRLRRVTHRLPSGPLHDAAEVCRAGVPTVMLFVQSLHGISHNKIEDTREDHLALSVRALDRLATATMDWIVESGVKTHGGAVGFGAVTWTGSPCRSRTGTSRRS